MKIIRDPYTELNIKTVVALGCFDGVHIAHRAVIEEAVRVAHELGVTPAVWCFSEPPRNAYAKTPVPLITDYQEKARLIRELGIEVLITPDFDERIRAVDAEQFIYDILCGKAGAVHLVCGRNYTFGAGGVGRADVLRAVCERRNVGVSVVDEVTLDGEPVSSTRIRDAVGEGRCKYASSLLGRTFSVTFDSSNVRDDRLFLQKKYLFVPDGIYELTVSENGERRYSLARVSSDDLGHYVEIDGLQHVRYPITLRFDSDRSVSEKE